LLDLILIQLYNQERELDCSYNLIIATEAGRLLFNWEFVAILFYFALKVNSNMTKFHCHLFQILPSLQMFVILFQLFIFLNFLNTDKKKFLRISLLMEKLALV